MDVEDDDDEEEEVLFVLNYLTLTLHLQILKHLRVCVCVHGIGDDQHLCGAALLVLEHRLLRHHHRLGFLNPSTTTSTSTTSTTTTTPWSSRSARARVRLCVCKQTNKAS